MSMRHLLLLGLLLTAPFSFAVAIDSPTLNSVRDRGSVVCGINDNLDGFAKADSLGEYSGFDVDICKAIAAAIFADPEKTEFISTAGENRIFDLVGTKVDVQIGNTAWTLSRDASTGEFTGINFYDGQGFMVWKRARVRSTLELDNISLCVQNDSDAQTNAANYFDVNNLRYAPVLFDTRKEAQDAYSDGLCDAITTNQSSLAVIRANQKDPDAHRILSAVVSKDPLSPLVRANDTGWANVVRWSLYCMINAEELGVSSSNVDSINETDSIDVQRLAGFSGNYGDQLELSNTWCADIIRAVGNYAESYERHLGENTAINLPRGINNLWTNGGLIFAPPIR